jgi:hypothetical protein
VIAQQRFFLGLLLAGIGACSLGLAAPPSHVPSQPARDVVTDRPRRFVSIEQAIRRDPFAGAPQPVASPSSTEADVPDIEGDSAPGDQRPEYTLKATIVGAVPVAYVAAGSLLRLLRVGDDLDDRRVVSIDARGLALSDGSRLDLPAAYAPTAPPHARGAARRVPATPRARRTPDAGDVSTESGRATPVTLATAGPLPTVKAGAYPIGVRPTSDPAAPTAFPYPYPYPPR